MNESVDRITEPALDIDAAIYSLARAQMRRAIRDILIFFGITTNNIESYINDIALRNDLIRSLYARGRAQNIKSERIIVYISNTFNISYHTAYRIVHTHDM